MPVQPAPCPACAEMSQAHGRPMLCSPCLLRPKPAPETTPLPPDPSDMDAAVEEAMGLACEQVRAELPDTPELRAALHRFATEGVPVASETAPRSVVARLLAGEVVTLREGTPDEAWAYREEVPRCGTVYLVKGVDDSDTKAFDSPEKAADALEEHRAAPPTLTVEDVLGVLDMLHRDVWFPNGACVGPWHKPGGYALHGPEDEAPLVTGTLAEVLTAAKARVLL